MSILDLPTPVLALFIVLALYVLYKFRDLLIVVPQNHVCIVERLSNNARVLQPGLHLLASPLDAIRPMTFTKIEDAGRTKIWSRFIPMQEMNFDIEEFNVTTSDHVPIRVNTSLYLKVVDPKKFTYTFPDAGLFISDVAQSSFNTFLGDKTVTEILKSPAEIARSFKEHVAPQLGEVGVVVTRVMMQDVKVSPELRQAFEQRVTGIVTSETRLEAEKTRALLEAKTLELEKARAEHQAFVVRTAARARADADLAFLLPGEELSPEAKAELVVNLRRLQAQIEVAQAYANSSASKIIITANSATADNSKGDSTALHIHTDANHPKKN
jgi:regulator of protease activity HflC (stomatin/prohibitin superfamily)